MSKEPSSWTDEEQVRRVFKLTPDDLHFLLPLRSDPTEFPAAVVTYVSKQLGLKPSVLSQLGLIHTLAL